MGVPVDLSTWRVLFICTGMSSVIEGDSLDLFKETNNLDTISAPLLDRIEVLEVSGYVSEEKAVITSRSPAPQVKDASGIAEANIQLEPSVDAYLIIQRQLRLPTVRLIRWTVLVPTELKEEADTIHWARASSKPNSLNRW